jgi:hypothetical protein
LAWGDSDGLGTVKVTASADKRVVGSGRAKAKRDGTATATVRFSKSGVNRLKKLRRVRLTVRLGGGPPRTVTLKH